MISNIISNLRDVKQKLEIVRDRKDEIYMRMTASTENERIHVKCRTNDSKRAALDNFSNTFSQTKKNS